MTTSNTYTETYAPRASQRGIDLGGPLNAALNEQRGVDGQGFYATDLRQLLLWDQTTYQTWTPADGKAIYQAYSAGPPIVSRFLFDDFRSGTIDTRYSGANTGGAGAAGPTNTVGVASGEMTLVSGTANTTGTGTGVSSLTADLGWTPNVVQPWQQVGATAAAGAALQAKAHLPVQGQDIADHHVGILPGSGGHPRQHDGPTPAQPDRGHAGRRRRDLQCRRLPLRQRRDHEARVVRRRQCRHGLRNARRFLRPRTGPGRQYLPILQGRRGHQRQRHVLYGAGPGSRCIARLGQRRHDLPGRRRQRRPDADLRRGQPHHGQRDADPGRLERHLTRFLGDGAMGDER